jgi:methionyl-tRNA synthetase
MVIKYQKGLIGSIPDVGHDTATYEEAISLCKFDRCLDLVWEKVRGLNQYIDETKPWVIAKEGDEVHLREVLATQVGDLMQIADLLEPFMPETAVKIRNMFVEGIVRPSEKTLFPKFEVIDATTGKVKATTVEEAQKPKRNS